MRQLAGKAVRGVGRALPLGAYQALIRRDVVGLFYHSVSDAPLPHVQHLYAPEPVARFEAALQYIKRHHHPVTDGEIEAHRVEGKPLPRRAMHLSFDDGFSECYSVVRPLLLKHSIPCTFYVTTGWLDNASMFYRNKTSLCIEQMRTLERDAAKMVLTSLNNALGLSLSDAASFERWIKTQQAAEEGVIDMTAKMLGVDVKAYLQERSPYLTREQVRALHADGFTIGAHTVRHAKLATLSDAEIESEIVTSAREVQAITGQERVTLSFPYSGNGLSRKLLADIRQRHPWLGLFYDTQDLQRDVPFIVQRIWAEKAAFREAGQATNVPALLRDAYEQELYDVARRGPGTRDVG
ncbi:MAG: polysaccharide deacetylase family protein [Anaerolineales bacterium]|nr:MAG: polysaccharide deacetylase family protein [Anaerolineales bacterium]